MAAANVMLLPPVVQKSGTATSSNSNPFTKADSSNGREFARMVRESNTARANKAADQKAGASERRASNDVTRLHADKADAAGCTTAAGNGCDSAANMADSNNSHPAPRADLPPALFAGAELTTDTVLTSTEASSLLDRLAGLQAQGLPIDPTIAAALTDGLQSIVETGEPMSVSEILASNRLMQAHVQQPAAAPVAPTDTAQSADGLFEQVSAFFASLFADEAPATTPIVNAEPQKPEEEANNNAAPVTDVIITPLAQSLVVPMPTATTTAAPTVQVATAAPTDAVSAVELSRKAVSIDTLIPSLELTAEEKAPKLPEIELPKTNGAQAAPQAPAPVAAKTPTKLEQQLAALDAATSVSAKREDGVAALAENALPKTATANTDGTPPMTVIPTGGVAATQSTTPIFSLAQGIVNNAPIREQVHVAISKAAADGVNQLTIQLDPVGLGRVEVKLHAAQDGQTQIAFLVDKPETFDALSRDARGLERALQDSGLKTDSGGMQFNLRQQPQNHADMGGNGQHSSNPSTPEQQARAAAEATVAATTKHYSVAVRDGIDIQA